eukprot:scaffold5108_cov172-Amphora_coffeaeformis.AAC.13
MKQLVPSFTYFERLSIGLWDAVGAIFVAGGGPVYSAKDGSEIVACEPPEAGFLKDLIQYKGYLYMTDSKVNQIFIFDSELLVYGKCEYSTISLPEDGFFGDGFPYSNGVEIYKDGLVISTIGGDPSGGDFEMAQFWYVDLAIDKSNLVIGGAIGDGLLVAGEPLNSVLDVYELDYDEKSGVAATKLDEITSELFVGPSNVTQYKDCLYAVNLVRIFTACICLSQVSNFLPLGLHISSLSTYRTLVEFQMMGRVIQKRSRTPLISWVSPSTNNRKAYLWYDGLNTYTTQASYMDYVLH